MLARRVLGPRLRKIQRYLNHSIQLDDCKYGEINRTEQQRLGTRKISAFGHHGDRGRYSVWRSWPWERDSVDRQTGDLGSLILVQRQKLMVKVFEQIDVAPSNT